MGRNLNAGARLHPKRGSPGRSDPAGTAPSRRGPALGDGADAGSTTTDMKIVVEPKGGGSVFLRLLKENTRGLSERPGGAPASPDRGSPREGEACASRRPGRRPRSRSAPLTVLLPRRRASCPWGCSHGREPESRARGPRSLALTLPSAPRNAREAARCVDQEKEGAGRGVRRLFFPTPCPAWVSRTVLKAGEPGTEGWRGAPGWRGGEAEPAERGGPRMCPYPFPCLLIC